MTDCSEPDATPAWSVPGLGGHLAADHVADGRAPGADRRVPAEGIGLGEEPGVEDLAGGRHEGVDPGEGGAARAPGRRPRRWCRR